MIKTNESLARWAITLNHRVNGRLDSAVEAATQSTHLEGLTFFEKVLSAHGEGLFAQEYHQFWMLNDKQFLDADHQLVDACWYSIRLTGTKPSVSTVISMYNSVAPTKIR